MLRRAAFSLIAGLVVASACGSDSTAPVVDISVVGTYNLKTVNGQGLPFVAIQSGQNSVSLLADQIIVADGGTWTESSSARVVTNGVSANQVGSDHGTWLRSGSNVSLISAIAGNAPYNGTFGGNQMIVTDGTFAYVFSK